MPDATLPLAGAALLALTLLALALAPLWLIALGPPEDATGAPADAGGARPEYVGKVPSPHYAAARGKRDDPQGRGQSGTEPAPRRRRSQSADRSSQRPPRSPRTKTP